MRRMWLQLFQMNLPVDESIYLNLPPEEPVDVVYPVNVVDSVPTMSMRWENL